MLDGTLLQIGLLLTLLTEDFDIESHGKHAGRCNSDKFIYDEDTKPPMDGLRYWDSEGYSAGFEVGENFGCIHWMRSTQSQAARQKVNRKHEPLCRVRLDDGLGVNGYTDE